MSVVIICDRCKKQFHRRENVSQVQFYANQISDIGDVELCSPCIDAVKRFIRGEWQCSEPHFRFSGAGPRKCRGFIPGCANEGIYSGGLCDKCWSAAHEDRVNSPG